MKKMYFHKESQMDSLSNIEELEYRSFLRTFYSFIESVSMIVILVSIGFIIYEYFSELVTISQYILAGLFFITIWLWAALNRVLYFLLILLPIAFYISEGSMTTDLMIFSVACAVFFVFSVIMEKLFSKL